MSDEEIEKILRRYISDKTVYGTSVPEMWEQQLKLEQEIHRLRSELKSAREVLDKIRSIVHPSKFIIQTRDGAEIFNMAGDWLAAHPAEEEK